MMDAVQVERRGAVACVHMTLEHKRNVLTERLYESLGRVLEELQNQPDVRVVVLSGGRHFCAGGDLNALDATALDFRRAMHTGQRVVRALTGGRLAAVAAVEGNAYGAGFSLALACDFIVGDPNTTLCASFGRVGLVPDYGLLWTLPQRVGIARARRLVMLAEPVRAERALEWGLIDQLTAPGNVLDGACALAESLAAMAPATIATTKSILSRAPLTFDATLAWEADLQALLVRSEDFAEGVRAFRTRSAPTFQDR